MKQFEIVYNENKTLDKMFDELYDNSLIDTIKKNKLELLVELGELANETRCFKYWSNKPSRREAVLEEYADCLLMVFMFFNMLDISLNEEFAESTEKDEIIEFNTLFYKSSLLMDEFNKENVKIIFSHLINLGHLLGFSDEDIIDGSLKKIIKNKGRFETGF